jgi:hypothetical protein
MKENVRRPLLFGIIVIVGSILVVFDVPLIILIPLIIAVGFVILLALGAITVPEIKNTFSALKLQNLKKTGILKRLDPVKFSGKSPPAPGAKPVPKPEKKEVSKETGKPGIGSRIKALFPTRGSREPKPEKKEVRKETDKKPGLVSHVRTLFSSIGSLGSVIRQRSKQGKKVDDINKLLDKAVSEKVHAPPPASIPKAATPPMPAPPGGSGAGLPGPSGEADPFLSLSGDEFDAALLDGLGDDAMDGLSSPGPDTELPGTGDESGQSGGTDLPPPALDFSSAAGDILKDNGEGLEEFSGLDGGETPDSDFGDLDSLSLDDLEGELGDDALSPAPDEAPAPVASPAPAASPSPDDSTAVKTAWIPSDAPKDADQPEDQVSTQADMAAFAGGSSSDEDMLSSLASDVKHVKKEQDVSLLRELKDFRAPANEIEQELSGVYERMSSTEKNKKKAPPSITGTK